VVNPEGYGKTALVAEVGSRRDELFKKGVIESTGPVLLTNFNGLSEMGDFKSKLHEEIEPLFVNPNQYGLADWRGKVFCVFACMVAYGVV
jgi:hypothetical protein